MAFFNATERPVVALCTAISSLRIFGLFLILPVLTLHVADYEGATLANLGLAFSLYGLFQALFQFPLAYLSDRIGRFSVLQLGLALFVAGSLISAFSHSIVGLLIGRSLQGMGAISGTLSAVIADHTRPEVRSFAMAILGMGIGASFMLATVLGPFLDASFHGVSGIFLLMAAFGALGFLLLWSYQKQVASAPQKNNKRWGLSLAKHQPYWASYIAVLSLHALLTMVFLSIPLTLENSLQLSKKSISGMYTGALFCALAFVLPILRTRRTVKMHYYFLLCTIGLLGFLWLPLTVPAWLCALLFFFVGFTTLEAVLPSYLSQKALPEHRGEVMGLFSTFQYFGVFLGGLLGGKLLVLFGSNGPIYCAVAVTIGVAYLLKPKTAQNPAMLHQ